MEVQGKIIAALPERSGVSQRGEWKSQDFVVETNDSQYPRKMVFTVFGADRLQRFNIQVGQTVNVAFDIDAHEWNGRWFNDVRAFDVRLVDLTQPAPAAVPVGTPVASQSAPQAAPQAAPIASQPLPEVAPVADAGDSTDNLPF